MAPTRVIESGGRPREIAPGIWWLGVCVVTRDERYGVSEPLHIYLSNYLVVGDEQTIIFDCGEPSGWPALDRQLDQVLGDRPLDWILPSHPELPHAANTSRLLEKYPDAKIIGDISDWHLFLPDQLHRLVRRFPGQTLDLGGPHRIKFLPAPIRDLPNSMWAYETHERVMFVSDAFSFGHGHFAHPDIDDEYDPHLSGECGLMTGEAPGGIERAREQTAVVLRAALPWLKYCDPTEIFADLEHLLAENPARLIGPAHGHVVSNPREDVSILREEYEVVSYRPTAGG